MPDAPDPKKTRKILFLLGSINLAPFVTSDITSLVKASGGWLQKDN